MPRKTQPRTSVAMRQNVKSFFLPTWEAQTARAMVKLLPMRTTVLMAPSQRLMDLLACAKISGYVERLSV